MNEEGNSTIKTHVPDKGISEITRRNLERYDEAALLARTGIPSDPNFAPRNFNEKTENRFEGLNMMLSMQQHIISGNNMATVEKKCYNQWKRKYREEEKRRENPFEDEDNDINELKEILEILDKFEEKIENARRTKSLKDDFVIDKEDGMGVITKVLTPHFYTMYKKLVETYREIYGILIDNDIVALKSNEDEDRTEQEKEEELKRRIIIA